MKSDSRPDQSALDRVQSRELAAELIAQAIRGSALADPVDFSKGVVMCIPEDAAQSVLEALSRAGVTLIVPTMKGQGLARLA